MRSRSGGRIAAVPARMKRENEKRLERNHLASSRFRASSSPDPPGEAGRPDRLQRHHLARSLLIALAMPLQRDPIVAEIISSAIRVHTRLGPGLLESAYEACLAYELHSKRIRVEQQVPVPLVYDEVKLDCGYRLDLLVDRNVIVEVKSVEALLPVHTAQVLTYMRLAQARQTLLFNFNLTRLKDGLKSFLPRESRSPLSGPLGSQRTIFPILMEPHGPSC